MKILNLILILLALSSGITGMVLNGHDASRLFFIVALLAILIRIMRFVAFEFYCGDDTNNQQDTLLD